MCLGEYNQQKCRPCSVDLRPLHWSLVVLVVHVRLASTLNSLSRDRDGTIKTYRTWTFQRNRGVSDFSYARQHPHNMILWSLLSQAKFVLKSLQSLTYNIVQGSSEAKYPYWSLKDIQFQGVTSIECSIMIMWSGTMLEASMKLKAEYNIGCLWMTAIVQHRSCAQCLASFTPQTTKTEYESPTRHVSGLQ